MKITFAVVGSTGDLQPFIALGSELIKREHQVIIATHKSFKQTITDIGAEFFPIEGNPQKIFDGNKGKKWLNSGKSVLKFAYYLKLFVDEITNEIANGILNACQGSDMLLYSTLIPMGEDIGRYLDIPTYCIFLQPLMPTTEFPAMLLPQFTGKFPIYNKLSHKIASFIFFKIFEESVSKWRYKRFGIGPLAYLKLFSVNTEKKVEYFYPISHTVMKKPHDWPDNIHTTGYWFIENNKEDTDIEAFINAGKKPIYIGFGSMKIFEKKQLLDIIAQVMDSTDNRAVFCTGWSGIENIDLKNVFMTSYVNHSKYFNKFKMIIHHGGSGTTASAFKSGIPQIVLPFFADQFFWARTVKKLNCGLSNKFSLLNVDILVKMINDISDNEEMSNNALKIAGDLKNENGLEQAIRIIENKL